MGKRPKIAVIGAGSLSHGKRLIDDLFTVAEFSEGDLALMGTYIPRLEVVGNYAKRAAGALRPNLKILVTDRQEPALEGADIVLATFDAGGYPAFDHDYRIAERYGLDVCIGDTVGPLGAMRALRNGKVMLALAGNMKKTCPNALLVNYVNPMAPMVASAASTGIRCIGICGGIEATRSYTANLLGLALEELRTIFAGVNHLCWLLDIEGPSGDLYPRFRELMQDPELRGDEAARFEILQQFGYFATESSGHISDFFPYFRRTPELRKRYCSGPGYSGASGAYHKLSAFMQRRIGNADYLKGEEPSHSRSPDYGVAIVEAWIGGKRCSVHGNVMNTMNTMNTMNSDADRKIALPGLPPSACVEIPIEVDQGRLSIPPAPELPSALAALCVPSTLQHGLVVEALLSRDPETLFAAIAQDQSTAALLDLPTIRDLASELLAANAEWLPAGMTRLPRATVKADIRPLCRKRETRDPNIELVRNYERRRRGESQKESPGKKGDCGQNPGL